MLTPYKHLLSTGLISIALYGCATNHQVSEKVSSLEAKYESSVNYHDAEYAPVEFDKAKDEISKLRTMEKDGKDSAAIDHQYYIAEKTIDTAIETAKQKRAEKNIEGSEMKRTKAMLSAKDKQLDRAEATADAMTIKAAIADSESKKARELADRMEDKASQMAEKAKEMSNTLKNISSSQTERGLVLTMGSILFELDEADLKQGSQGTIARVAEFLNQYPDRHILVEGFTDSTGSESYNQSLSEKRAQKVVNLLQSNGVAFERLNSVGYGESFPVSNNDTNAGRQKNRRVELVIANSDNEKVSERN